MAEINPNFSFPMATPPPPNSIPQGLGSPARPRPKSAGGYMLSPGFAEPESNGPRRRTHMHRRSAAMSEDLSTQDLSAITGSAPPIAAFGTSAPTPSVLSQYMRSSESPSKSPYPPSPAMNPLWQNYGASESNSSLNLNGVQRTQSGNRVMFIEPVSPHRSPWRRQQVTPLGAPGHIATSGSPAPSLQPQSAERLPQPQTQAQMQMQMPMQQQPHPLTPPNDAASPRSSPSPAHSHASIKSKKDGERKHHSRRRSLARMFKWSSKDSQSQSQPQSQTHSSNQNSSLSRPESVLRTDDRSVKSASPQIPNLQPESAEVSQELPPSAYVTPPMPLPPKFSSPALSPSDLYDTMEPQPPSIDLDEALSCSFSHRRSESLPAGLDSPFSKTTSGSYIGPVLEEEDEEQDDSGSTDDSSSMNSRHANLQRSKSVNSHTRSVHTRPDSYVSTTSRAPMHAHHQQSPITSLGIPCGSPSRMSFESAPLDDAKTPSMPPPRGHTRRRSLIDRMLGRPMSMPPPAASGQ